MQPTERAISADFTEICKSIDQEQRSYLSDIVGKPDSSQVLDKSFGLSGGDGVHYIYTDALFVSKSCAKAYYGNFVRLNFFLKHSFLKKIHYGIKGISLGDALVVKDQREAILYAQPGTRILGLNILVDPDALIDLYGLRPDLLDYNLRISLTSRRNFPVAEKLNLAPRLYGAIEVIERCVSNDVLSNKLLKAKSEEIICEVVYRLNRSTAAAWNERPRLTRDQIIYNKIQAIAHYYEQNMQSSPNVEFLARKFGLNRNILNEAFKEIYGMPPGLYSRKRALEWAKEQLSTGVYRIKEVAHLSGYSNASAFSRAYLAYFGCKPTESAK